MTRRALLRASDADREQTAEQLRRAATEGRLSADELDERLGAALSARTYGELDALVADLPAPPVVHRGRSRGPVGLRRPVAVAVGLVLALMLVTAVGSLFGGHPHQGRHWGYGGAGSLIWLAWIVIAVRLFMARRGGLRR